MRFRTCQGRFRYTQIRFKGSQRCLKRPWEVPGSFMSTLIGYMGFPGGFREDLGSFRSNNSGGVTNAFRGFSEAFQDVSGFPECL